MDEINQSLLNHMGSSDFKEDQISLDQPKSLRRASTLITNDYQLFFDKSISNIWDQPSKDSPIIFDEAFTRPHSSSLSIEEPQQKLGMYKHFSVREPVSHSETYLCADFTLIENALINSRDQSGCRLLQKKLDEGNREFQESLFDKILPFFHKIMQDSFGNYLCQKMIQTCSEAQLARLFEVLTPQMPVICLNNHGTRAVQSIIERITGSEALITKFISIIQVNLGQILDDHGNHVIQNCISSFKWNTEPLYEVITENCLQIASNKHGCCVLQRCLENGTLDQRQKLSDIIIESIDYLIKDPFGNYVVQYTFQLQMKKIIAKAKNSFIELATHKFASNVIEKCFDVEYNNYLDEIYAVSDEIDNLHELLVDPYGNYGKPPPSSPPSISTDGQNGR